MRRVMARTKKRGLFPFTTVSVVPLVVVFVVVILSNRCTAAIDSLNYTKMYNRQVSSLRLDRIHRHLDKINKPPLFTIQSPDGDIIDCVHKRKQPAMDHPLLKNHKIRRVPPGLPRSTQMGQSRTNSSTTSVDGWKGVWQTWHQNGQLCPKGTLPVRRTTVHDVLRAKSLFYFGKKQFPNSLPFSPTRRSGARPDSDIDSDPPDLLSGNNGHE
ncbi:hypothetical protein MIMGU_mgv1a0255902mg, partial [Erythranthe guttata]